MASKEQLMQIVEMIRNKPELMEQLGGAPMEVPEPAVGVTGVTERAGLSGPMTKGIYEAGAKQAMKESAPSEVMDRQKVEQARGLAAPFLEQIAPGGKIPEGQVLEGVTVGPDTVSARFGISPDVELDNKRKSAEIETDEQLKRSKLKEVRESRADLTNARLKINNAFDSWLEMVDRTQRISGAQPGIMGGVITEVLGKTRTNEFVKAFKGGLTEYAAAVGRIAIPGARAVRLVNLFKETAPTTFDTVPSAIEQSALSFKNGLASDMRLYPEEYIPGLEPDERLTEEHYNILQDYLRKFQDQYREGLYKQAFDKNPELVPSEIRARFQAEAEGQLVPGTSDDDINALLDRMGAD